jgi:hypothetical protein
VLRHNGQAVLKADFRGGKPTDSFRREAVKFCGIREDLTL